LHEIDHKNKYIIISTANDKKWNFKNVKNIIIPWRDPVGWTIWSNVYLPRIIKNEKIDVYHSLKHITLFGGNCKKVVTFHSSRFFFLPEHYKWYEAMHWRAMYPVAAKKYDKVIAVSSAEKINYTKYIHNTESKYRVINLAADRRFRKIDDASKLQKAKKKYHLPDHFILFVGRIIPVKNIETIIIGYHLAKKTHAIKQKLVIVGHKTWYFKEIVKLVNNLQHENDIIFTGPVYEDLPCIYNLADLFLFPSFYEAFPAVPLEAMASGIPVITSNSGGLPEVVGDAAIQVPAESADHLAKAILRVILSEKTRRKLIENGLQRAKKFSWERCATEHLQLYEEIYNG
jgi:glycosyltransferase involved in cell wall biosynthesis